MSIRAGVLTVSDGCSRGEREDISGRVLAEGLIQAGIEVAERALATDDMPVIQKILREWCSQDFGLIITTGGTGFAPRDITPEATRSVIEREAPGLAELLRWKGYQKLDRAVLSRGLAGICQRSLIINLPGSVGGVRDGLEILLPLIPHAIAIIRDEPVDHTPLPAGAPTPQTDAPPATIISLETNIDDLSPEFYELLMERLFEAGALDVYLTPIQMKKSRPALLLTVLAPLDIASDLTNIMFVETSTFGIRTSRLDRFTLDRKWVTVETEYGALRIKVGSRKGIVMSASPEYEDLKAAAKLHSLPLKKVYEEAIKSYHKL